VALVYTTAAAGAALMGACTEDEPLAEQPWCPNHLPDAGAPCEAGLECNYVNPTGCPPIIVARCGADGGWELEDECTAPGGSGGTGAEGGSGGEGGGVGGAAGGEGGAGGTPCVDDVPGPPAVISVTTAVYPPDTTYGKYRLEFSEPVTAVATNLTWTGPGALAGVSKVNQQAYDVTFTGMAPGDAVTLTVEPGPKDDCGNELDTAVPINLSLLPSCHFFAEDFEANFLSAGWSTTDNGSDGNLWARNDQLSVANHTNGAGLCAAANDVASGPTSDWDANLLAPVISLTGGTHVVLRYQSDFQDDGGNGQAWLDGSSNGVSWTNLTSWTNDRGPLREFVDLSAYGGGNLYLRWRYSDDAGQGAWWDVDDVCVEEFTQATCPCPTAGHAEANDQAGVQNLNGTLGTAEDTAVTLATVGNRVTVCGLLEDNTKSGSDWFSFDVQSGMAAGTLDATVEYCLENSFEDATIQVWAKEVSNPLATYTTAHTEGSFEVELIDGKKHYLAISTNGAPYAPADYTIEVEVESMMTAILTEGFEIWPPLAFTVTDDDPCLTWDQSSQSTVPPGEWPTEGNSLAYFNSYDCQSGSESLVTAPLNFSGATTLLLFLDMLHDPGYGGSFDNIQVQYDEGQGWLDIGPQLDRPAQVQGWETEMVDLSALAGKSSILLRLYTTTAYGNNLHIDNVALLSD